MAEIYRPSNGTEGDCFFAAWCAQCERDKLQNGSLNADECDENDLCSIIHRTMMWDVDDAEYPQEWIRDEAGPRCLAFVPLGGQVPIRDDRTIDMFLDDIPGDAIAAAHNG